MNREQILTELYESYGARRRDFKNAEIAENLAREKKLEVAKDLADLRVKIELIEEDLGIQDGSELSEDGL